VADDVSRSWTVDRPECFSVLSPPRLPAHFPRAPLPAQALRLDISLDMCPRGPLFAHPFFLWPEPRSPPS
jgi:hypothetical protein